MIKFNLAKVAEFDTAVFYKAICDCMSNSDAQTLTLELDKNLRMIFLEIDANYEFGYWKDNFIGKLWWRFKTIIRILFTGYAKASYTFIFREEGLRSYVEALQEGIKKLEAARKNPCS